MSLHGLEQTLCAEFLVIGDLVEERHHGLEHVSISVGEDRWDSGDIDFGCFVVELDEADRWVIACELPEALFKTAAHFGL
jgi:hypothetical protein